MPIGLVKEQIHKFLSTDKPEVLAIKGGWGVGKTHSWEQFAKEFKADCALSHYSYVSLFGVNSINDIKKAVFLNTIDTRNIGQPLNLKSRSKSWTEALQSIKVKGVSVGDMLGAVSQLATDKTVICFDDLERHSKGITIKDFMGLASYYKEQKGCKVVLLLNEDVGDETFSDYQKYKEKVVDKQLHFEPTAEESFDIMYESDGGLRDYVRQYCVSLNLKNKRIIKKIEQHIQDSLGQLADAGFDITIQQQIARSVVLLSFSYYSSGTENKRIPSFRYLTCTKNLHDDDYDKELHQQAIDNKWDEFQKKYNFLFLDELDLALATGIKQGFFDGERLSTFCSSKQTEIDIRKRSEKLEKAWDIYHGSFDLNDADVIAAMEAGLRDIVEVASPSQYGSGISVLRDIGNGGDEKADELITFYIDTRKNKPDVFNLDSFDANPFGARDEKFAEKLREARKVYTPELTIEDILEKRKGSSSYNAVEAEILNKMSKDEVKAMFMSFKGKSLYDNINVFILLSGGNASLKRKVDNALEEIAAMSSLNKSRMGKFQR
ncbi:hypothetical protein [Vibrio crassostreae]|uniref:hypothetical protein n=1 Tax=Vibrio crassostreae TaxID=246167 RepID=UPI0006375A79|nr:hypothetical protein [Vibrio crassostreae]TCN96146.1 hypothetical protein EDB30_11838 [Vibrio crassostreae]CAK1814530.1 KAP NTPase domain-containing protein [Vibrio crassostreae]CAK1815537.1 KAP NTPase domain-containing protein [Vibrio crassostreae]CAK1816297.1 KAP NTPase domain-containing protein [Vibrio crassostreae]CAK1997642.1 KAP NTPase domain-containing protein [Vibrio crassostreae]